MSDTKKRLVYFAFVGGEGCVALVDHISLEECQKIQKPLNKLAEYEDLDKKGLLLRLPCNIGDVVYVVPSETQYKLNVLNGYTENNKVYKQTVGEIRISNYGCSVVTCDGLNLLLDNFFGETWFLTEEEAEAKLKEMRGKKNEQ